MGQVVTELARRAAIRLRRVGTMDLIDRADAPAFLDACNLAGVRVVGIEGFRTLDQRVEPDMDWIADFSGTTDPGESVEQARRFIESSPEGLGFDFVVADPEG